MCRTASGLQTFTVVLGLNLILFVFAPSIHAQGYNFLNPADQDRPWVTENNPAIVSFKNTEISLGLKLFHIGFLEDNKLGLRETRLNFSAPFYLPWGLAAGLDLRQFSAGIYSEVSTALLLSKEVYPRVALGAKFAVDHRGFSKQEFNIVDPTDPLFNSGLSLNALNLGGGIMWKPAPWSVALSVDHLNSANVGLINETTFPVEVAGALGYKFGLFTPTIIGHRTANDLNIGFLLTAEKPDVGLIRFGYENTLPFKVEASLNLSKRAKLDYSVDLPNEGTIGASAGSQEFVYTHILAKRPVIGSPDIFFSTYKLDIVNEKQIRMLEGDLRIEDISNSNELTSQYFTPTGHDDDYLFLKAGPLSAFETRELEADRHARLVASMAQAYQQNPDINIVLWATQATLRDAQQLAMSLESRIPVKKENLKIVRLKNQENPDLRGFVPGRRMVKNSGPQLSKSRLVIAFKLPNRTRTTNGWKFTIKNSYGKPVQTFEGTGNLPKAIAWDWQDFDGHLIPAGYYTGSLVVNATDNTKRNASSKELSVYNIKRTVTMKFTSDEASKVTQQNFKNKRSRNAE